MSPVQEIAAGRVQSGAIDQLASALEMVDVESGLSWPSGVEDPQFLCFLDKLGGMFDTLPSSADATLDPQMRFRLSGMLATCSLLRTAR
jgi:hypothetical protein